ncbi:hypothetical protein COCSUDRAFT_40078 [Coccomyxa subellipsoidea C-169]|uniref:Uncharacterized protein n=1 Tax=Coccomyxa subellipsoidea (strain C-169) TaxID=574566 RepID=I0Z5A1_COCSC|nr:hypothetical protein COCSUDRAFT_40078 [Coccomyxa subellipsoidea C-169]EIE25820.1 hypothetical protein COCSUDRAFT_40078 [Coccomyxa subellipsoidea C-169]|eukprot:XP_005650364.1 hypothetical protein COCSUDRAFT_40078 [Coccomyxa subellipsoidea C-169]
MATEKPKVMAVPSGRGSLSGRLSISRNNPNSAPSQAASKVLSDSDDERATAEVFPERAGMQPQNMSMQSGAQEMAAGGREYLTAPYTQQDLEIPEQTQPDGAFSLLPGPRASFAAARRASAPVNALPHIPEEPPVQQVSGATPGVLFAKRRSSAHPLLSGSGRSSVSLQMQPNTPQRQHEHSRRSSLAPATTDYPQPLPEQPFSDAAPPEPDSFDPAAFSAAYGIQEENRDNEGLLRRADDSFSFSTDAPHQQQEPAHLPEALPGLGNFARTRVSTLSEGERSGRSRGKSEPASAPTAVTAGSKQAATEQRQPPTKQKLARGLSAEPVETQPSRRGSHLSSVVTNVESVHEQEGLTPVPYPPTALQVPYGGDSKSWQPTQGLSLQQEQPIAQQNFMWSSPPVRASASAEMEDLSSVRATGSLAWSSLGILRAGSVPMRATGNSLAWTSRSVPAGTTAGPILNAKFANTAQETRWKNESPAARDEGRMTDAPGDQEVFKVYDNQVAASTEAAEQLLQSATQQTAEASMTSAFAGLATDVQQLDAKFGAWSQRSEDVCMGIQCELIQLRRGTADDISAIGARLELLEARKIAPPPQQQPQQTPAENGSGWDQQFTMDIIERLDALEVRVASQLDQLTSAHEERISAIKGNLHASVAEAAAVACSRPGSPLKASAGTATAEIPGSRLELPVKGTCFEDPTTQFEAAPSDAHQKKDPGTAQKAHDLGFQDLAKRVAQLEASHTVFMAADRSKAKLAVTDAVAAAALDKRLCTMEEQLHSAHGEAADANGCARGAQQRIAAAEWRIEKVATACAATVKALTARQERLANSLSLVKGTASLADAKCAALGAEIAKLYRDSGLKRAAHSGSSGKKVPRMPLAG